MSALLLAAAGLAGVFSSVRQDGPVKLPEDAQQEIVALLPQARKGEECPEPAKVAETASGLRDRGNGAVVVAEITSCKGGRVYAFSPGTPVRIARLMDVGEAQEVKSVRALALRGGKRDDDLGVEVLTSPTASDLRLYERREGGFVFVEVGALHEFAALRECAAGGEEGSGWQSLVHPSGAELAVLRIDGSCAGGPWQARCVTFRLDRDALSKSGVCALPRSLEAKALKAAGWR